MLGIIITKLSLFITTRRTERTRKGLVFFTLWFNSNKSNTLTVSLWSNIPISQGKDLLLLQGAPGTAVGLELHSQKAGFSHDPALYLWREQ